MSVSVYPDSMKNETKDLLVKRNYMSPMHLPTSRYSHEEWAAVQCDIELPLSEVIYIKNVLFNEVKSTVQSFPTGMDSDILSKVRAKGYIDLNNLPNSRKNKIEWEAIKNDCDLNLPEVLAFEKL